MLPEIRVVDRDTVLSVHCNLCAPMRKLGGVGQYAWEAACPECVGEMQRRSRCAQAGSPEYHALIRKIRCGEEPYVT